MDSHEQWREAVSAYADEECDQDERTAVEAHLSECADCRQWLEQLESDREVFTETLTGRPADILDAVMKRVTKMSAQKRVAGAKPKPAFTLRLAELFAVVGICAVLAAVLFPVFSRGRAKARVSSCLSNVKQVVLAMQMYADDYDGHLPNAWTWTEDMAAYLNNEEILQCPLAPMEPSSYAMVKRWSEWKLEDIPDESKAIIIYDAQPDGTPAFRHNDGDGLNAGFADGHAQMLSKKRWEELGMSTTAVTPGLPDRNYGLRRMLQLAYDAAIEVWVTDIQQSVVSAERTFYECGGFILQSSLTRHDTPGQPSTAQIVGKVPTPELANVINALGALGYVAKREIVGEDMTDEYTRAARAITQSQQKTQQLQVRRAAAPKAKRPQIDTELQQTQTELGQAQDEVFSVQREVALSTISATLREKMPQPILTARGLRAAWAGFVRVASVLGMILVRVLLYGLFFVPLIVAVVIWRRRRSIVDTAREGEPPAQTEDAS